MYRWTKNVREEPAKLSILPQSGSQMEYIARVPSSALLPTRTVMKIDEKADNLHGEEDTFPKIETKSNHLMSLNVHYRLGTLHLIG